MASMKWPPKLDDGVSYENWRKDIEIWCKLTDIPKKKQALAIHLALNGRARTASSELEVGDLEVESGVDTILGKLDGLFLVDKGRRQFEAFQALYNLRRPCQGNVRDFLSVFEHTYYKFTKQDMTLPDSVMAFMLLASCNLSDKEQQLVMTAMSEVTYQNMKSALSRIFHGEVSVHPNTQPQTQVSTTQGSGVKSEPVFLGAEGTPVEDEQKETFFVGGPRQAGPRGVRRGCRPRGPATRGRAAKRRQNPPGPDGRTTRCLVCDSRFHWARECPDAYESKWNVVGYDNNNKEVGGDEVHFSLFVGYASGDRGSRLDTLVKEARGYAVLDSGCATTVCGTKWLDDYLSDFSDVERGSIVQEQSEAKFTFGDGTTVTSSKCLTVPCMIGGLRGSIKTEVVDCNIPLLLSKSSMKKAKMVVNFGSDQVAACGRHINLKTSSSGHYLLPLSE